MFQSVAENVAKFKMEIDIFEKQPSEVFGEKSYSKKFRKIYRKKNMCWSPFSGHMPATLLIETLTQVLF